MLNRLKNRNQNYEKIIKEKKYIFIESKDIKRCTYEIKREFSCNDYDNVYYQTGYETIESIFKENGVPPKYQKIILEFDDNLIGYFTSNRAIKELLTKKEFFLKTISYSKKDGGYISGITQSSQLPESMYFTTNSDFFNYDKVLAFFRELNTHNLMDAYFHSLLLFFRKIEEEKKSEVIVRKLKTK